MSNDKTLIAQIGRTVGLRGNLKFYIYTDFPEQFRAGRTYHTNRGDLTIAFVDIVKGIIKFRGYESIDNAKKLTNTKFFASEEETKQNCELKEGEHFWFDIIGCNIIDAEICTGRVEDIQRIGETDYLYIHTDRALSQSGLPQSFLLPYINRYILHVDIDRKIIYTQDARDILEAS